MKAPTASAAWRTSLSGDARQDSCTSSLAGHSHRGAHGGQLETMLLCTYDSLTPSRTGLHRLKSSVLTQSRRQQSSAQQDFTGQTQMPPKLPTTSLKKE